METRLPASRSPDRPHRRPGPLRSVRTDQTQALVGRAGGADRRCRACPAAEYRAGRRLRDDECAVACRLSRPRGGDRVGARAMGTQRAPAYRTYAAYLVFSRTSDDLAAGLACRCARHCRPLEVAGAATHAHGVAPAHRYLAHDPEKACPGRDPGWRPVFG